MMFGSDFPLIRPDKWLEAAQQVGFKPEVLPLIMKDNAAGLLGLR
jgi:predicted TIM-barrel fold metal-dependent hydrolase